MWFCHSIPGIVYENDSVSFIQTMDKGAADLHAEWCCSGMFPQLLCINLHMAIWAWIVSNIEGVEFRAFIDDTYLWTRLPSIDRLVAAVRATELWDSLRGQFLNASKCEIFASNGSLRKAMKQAFPQMKLVEVVNILGAFVQTTKKNVGSSPPSKLQTALRDCEAIRALPCDSYTRRAQIIATKVMPQVAFAPQLNFLPKRLLARLQSAIADALWQNRPKWRSKHLLLCVIHKAHKLDPFLCRAVTTIVESVRFLQSSAHARQRWRQLLQDQLTAQAWMTQFSQARQILDILWTDSFEITAFDSAAVNFLDCSAPDLKCVLKNLAANKCYITASLMPRKGIHAAVGFLDLSLTLSAKKKLANVPNPGFSFLFHWESALIGCTLTADRLAAAGLVDKPNCRFCDAPKESLQHFVDECPSLP